MTSPSQKLLRAGIAVTSLGLAVLTVLSATTGSLAVTLAVLAVTPFVVLDPGSRLTTVLIAGHAANWLTSVPVPAQGRSWVLVLVVAVALAGIHLAAALASAFPAAAAVPGATRRRWARRTAAVLGLSVPVWVLLVVQSGTGPEGDPVLTYAALVALALLAFGFWQSGSRSATAESPRRSSVRPTSR